MPDQAPNAQSAAAAPHGSGLRSGRLHLRDLGARQERVDLLLAEVSQAFESDRFVQALGAFREAVNMSRGLHSLEERVLEKGVIEAGRLTSRNWRVAASLISDADELDKNRLILPSAWQNIHASQVEESTAKTYSAPAPPVNKKEPPEFGRRQTEAPQSASALAKIPAPLQGETPIQAAPLPSKEKTPRISFRKLDWSSLQRPVSIAATLVMVAAAFWAVRHASFENASKVPGKGLPAAKPDVIADSAAKRTPSRLDPLPPPNPLPWEIPQLPIAPSVAPNHRVDSTQVVVSIPGRKPPSADVSSEQHDWDQLSAGAGIDALQNFVLKYPNSVHAAEAKEEIQRLEWQNVDQGNSASLQAFVSAYPDTPYVPEARERLADLDRLEQAHEEEVAWDQVDKNSVTAVQSFLANHPAGDHREAARSVIADLDRWAEAVKLAAADESAWNSVRLTEQSSLENYLAQFPSGQHRASALDALADLRQRQTSKATESAVILSVIARLTNAWNGKDIDSIMALQANLDRRSIKSQLLAAKSVSMKVSPVSAPEISGSQAVVPCRRVTQEVFSDGAEKRTPESLVTYVLTKRNGSWIVSGVQ